MGGLTTNTKNHHPARFSNEIIQWFRENPHFDAFTHAHDPFAGTGERLGALADELGFTFSGTEIEECFIVDPRVRAGNSVLRASYPIGPFTIVTSPVYANGMTDNHKPQDGSRRRTYRVAKIAITGDPEAELLPDNMGAHGYRSGGKARRRYWDIANAVVAQWIPAGCTRAFVNVSDFIMAGRVIEHGQEWHECLSDNGFRVIGIDDVSTRRMRDGANRDARVEAEWIIEAVPL